MFLIKRFSLWVMIVSGIMVFFFEGIRVFMAFFFCMDSFFRVWGLRILAGLV